MAQLYVEIGAKVGAFQKALSQIERRVGRFSRKMERLGTDLTQAITLPLIGIGAGAVSTFAQFDKLEKGLSAIAGSADEGKRQLNDLLDVVKDVRTTIDLKAAATGSLQLQAVGISADRAKESLRQLGIAATVSGGSSDDVAEVARQLAQAAAKGNILQQELRIILERIPALAGVIKNEFGTVTAEGLRDAGVSADQFISRLTNAIAANERFANVQASLSKEIETFKINVQLAAKELGESIANAINLQENLRRLSAVIDRLVQGFKALTPETQSFIVKAGLIAAAIGPVLLIVGKLSSLIPVLLIGMKNLAGVAGLLGRAFVFLFSPIGAVVTVIVGLAAVMVIAYQRSERFRQIVNALVDTIVELGRIAKDVLSNLSEGFEALASFRYADAAKSFGNALSVIDPLRKDYNSSGARLGRAFSEGIEDGTNRVDGLIENIKDKVFKATSGIIPTAPTAAAVNLSTGTAGGASEGGARPERETIEIPTIETRDLIPETLEPATRRVAENVGLIGRSLQSLGVDADSMIVINERTKGVLEQMQPLTDLLSGPIQEGFSSLFTTLIEGGKNAFGGFIDGIKNLILQLAKAIATAAALSLILNLITGGAAGGFTGVFKSLLGGGGGLGGILKLIPGFAEGGIVPPGYPNDTYLARLSSNEAVIPLNKLNQYAGGPTQVTGEFRISGADLIAAVRRNDFNSERLTGK